MNKDICNSLSNAIDWECDHEGCKTLLIIHIHTEIEFGKAYCLVHSHEHGQCLGEHCFSKTIDVNTCLCSSCERAYELHQIKDAAEKSQSAEDRENRDIGAALRLIVKALK